MHYKQAVKAVFDGHLDAHRLPANNKVRVYMDMKYQPCHCCGDKHHPGVMDFHHINDDTKLHNMGYLLKFTSNDHIMSAFGDKPLKKIKQEAKKCVLLCSNCHRKVHAGLINLSDHLPVPSN